MRCAAPRGIQVMTTTQEFICQYRLVCVLSIHTVPGNKVITIAVNKTSGNEAFGRRAVTSVEKAPPSPLPADPAVFECLGLRTFNIRFKPRN